MEKSPKIEVKRLIYGMVDSAGRILEMQIAGGGLAVVFPSGAPKLSAEQLIFVAVIALFMLFVVVFFKENLK